MATHFPGNAWEIPWTEELGGLQSMGLQRVGHDLTTKQEQQYFLAVNLVFLRITTITIVCLYINLIKMYLFIQLCQVLVAACGIFQCMQGLGNRGTQA